MPATGQNDCQKIFEKKIWRVHTLSGDPKNRNNIHHGTLVGQKSEEEENRQESFVHLSFRSRSRTQDPAYIRRPRKEKNTNCELLELGWPVAHIFPIQENKAKEKTFPFFHWIIIFFNPIGTIHTVCARGRSSYFQVGICVCVTKTLEKRNQPVEDNIKCTQKAFIPNETAFQLQRNDFLCCIYFIRNSFFTNNKHEWMLLLYF